MKLSKEDLLDQLNEQLYFIEKSMNDYPLNEIEAKRAATNVRILVHDTNQSVSLLKQLDAKGIEFIDTSASKNSFSNWEISNIKISRPIQFDMFNVTQYVQNTAYVGLAGKKISSESDMLTIKYFPIYEKWPKSTSTLSFESWWDAEIYDNKAGFTLTRKELILNMVNKDGGAHIDSLKPDYGSFKNNNIIQFNIDGRIQGFDNIPAYPAVMQIAWELFTSITKQIDIIRNT